MRVTGSVTGDFAAAVAAESARLQGLLRQGLQTAADGVQDELRAQVRGAGLGPGLEKAWQQKAYADGPAVLVYSKATTLHLAFSSGATIVAKRGRYLAIPTREAEALGFATTNTTRAGGGTGSIPRRASMVQQAIERLGEKNIHLVDLHAGRRMIVYQVPAGRGAGQNFRGKLGLRRGSAVPLFILVPQVRLRPVLDLEGVRARSADRLQAEISAALA